jgi:hypothetical protein
MARTATYDDVNLVLRLYELRREDRLRQARAWFFANAKAASLEEMMKMAPPGTDENASFRMVVSYWDMVASFVTSGVLEKEIFFESGRELLLTYSRVKPFLAEIRGMFQDPMAWKNLEKVGEEFIEWMNKRSPGSYEAFAARVSGR